MSAQFMGIFTVGQTIDRGIKLYKMALPKIFLLLLIPMLMISTPTISAMAFKATTPIDEGAFRIFMLLGIFLNVMAYVAVVRYLYALSTGKTVESFGAILNLASAKDFLFIITFIIWYITAVVAFCLLVIPGIYLLVLSMMLAYPVCIIERRYFFNGIGRMLSLAEKRWWKTFALAIITLLLVIIPVAVAYSILFTIIVNGILTSESPEAIAKVGYSTGVLIGTLLSSAAAALITPLWPAVSIVHYNSLRCEKESSDLAGQLDALAAPNA